MEPNCMCERGNGSSLVFMKSNGDGMEPSVVRPYTRSVDPDLQRLLGAEVELGCRRSKITGVRPSHVIPNAEGKVPSRVWPRNGSVGPGWTEFEAIGVGPIHAMPKAAEVASG